MGEKATPNGVSGCPACKQACEHYEVSFSKEGIWCSHKGWELRTGLTRDNPPILGSTQIDGPVQEKNP